MKSPLVPRVRPTRFPGPGQHARPCTDTGRPHRANDPTARPRLAALMLGIAALALPPATLAQATAEPPFEVTVLSRVVFGTDGQAGEITLLDEATYPAPFAAAVRTRLERARIPPPQDAAGKPATFRTGVRMVFTVTPAATGAQVKVTGLSIEPLAIRRHYEPLPRDIARASDWSTDVVASCTVTVEGRCQAIHVQAQPGQPEVVRRYARDSLDRWEFEPQQVAGKPIEGEVKVVFRLNSRGLQPEDFRQPKFDALQKIR